MRISFGLNCIILAKVRGNIVCLPPAFGLETQNLGIKFWLNFDLAHATEALIRQMGYQYVANKDTNDSTPVKLQVRVLFPQQT